jgi:hypothetical protein
MRLELAEGMLVMRPSPPVRHQMARTRLGTLFDAQLPRDLTALPDVEVMITPDQLSGEHTGTAALDVAGHPISIDLLALTRRRRSLRASIEATCRSLPGSFVVTA